MHKKKQLIISTTLGGGLEFFDFVIYLFLSPTLATLFFPHKNASIALLATLGGFAAGYLARPLGGILYGHLGDRIGRMRTLVFSLFFMAIPTFLISCLPTYSMIGITAPILLILLRFAQGFAVGGDIPGAICFIGEHFSSKQRGFVTCCLLFGMNMGAVIASLVVATLISWLTPPNLLQWGWRLPFLMSTLLAIVGFYIRKKMSETPEFNSYVRSGKLERWPLKILLRDHWRSILLGFAIAGLAASITSIMSLFMGTYLSHYIGIPSTLALWINSISIATYSFCCLVMGLVIDRFSALRVLQTGAVILFLLAYPIFKLIGTENPLWIMLGLLLSAPLLAAIMGSIPSLLMTLFPTTIRYSGIGVSYNFGFSLFAGTSPLLVGFLISITGIKCIPAFFILFFVILAFPFILLLQQKLLQQNPNETISSIRPKYMIQA